MPRLFAPFLIPCIVSALVRAQGPPPTPPPPPQFMGMNGLPLACFDKPTLEDEGAELFVCNGRRGLAGFRKKADPAHIVFVQDADLAQNLNMQAAKSACAQGFAVRETAGVISFECRGREIELKARFRPASGVEWKKYLNVLSK